MQISSAKTFKKENGFLVVPFFHEYEKKVSSLYGSELTALVKQGLKAKEFTGKTFETLFYTVESKTLPQKVEFLGCGKAEEFNASLAREIGGIINDLTKAKKKQSVTILLTPELALYTQELTEGLFLRNYRVAKYKTGEDDETEKKKELKTAILVTQKPEQIKKAIERATIIADATNVAKDLINGPANMIDASYFEKIAKKLEADYGYKLTVLRKNNLEKLGWGGLLMVNQGSPKPPLCLIIEHNGGKKGAKPIIIVGKGIIFDTGGYNLKPTKSIEDMNMDKAGASSVIGIFSALKELDIKQNVIGIIPLTENSIGGEAAFPSNIITMLNGKTVEIRSTDAEGRMILADALTYGAERDPKYMIDIATLTGAVIYALGDRYSAMFTNNKELKERLLKAGEDASDNLWEMPLHKEHKEKMKSHIADLRNIDDGSAHLAGSSKGAAFLSYFIHDKKGADKAWAHIDIGATAYTVDPRKYEQRGGTGVGVRMLIKFLEQL